MKQIIIKLCPSINLNVQSYDLFFIFMSTYSVHGTDAISARTQSQTSQTFKQTIKGKHKGRIKTHDNFPEMVTLYTSCFLIK